MEAGRERGREGARERERDAEIKKRWLEAEMQNASGFSIAATLATCAGSGTPKGSIATLWSLYRRLTPNFSLQAQELNSCHARPCQLDLLQEVSIPHSTHADLVGCR